MIDFKQSYISGDRVKLLYCDVDILELLVMEDDKIAEGLNITVPQNWSTFGKVMFQYSIDILKKDPLSSKWLTFLPIQKELNCLLGTCGYKGKPTTDGIVEIGYEIAPSYQNNGYATEISKILIEHAFSHHEVQIVRAHTLAEENASVSVLKKSGFKLISEINDDSEGLIWQWDIQKS